jgi:hypothetical protein
MGSLFETTSISTSSEFLGIQPMHALWNYGRTKAEATAPEQLAEIVAASTLRKKPVFKCAVSRC